MGMGGMGGGFGLCCVTGDVGGRIEVAQRFRWDRSWMPVVQRVRWVGGGIDGGELNG